MHTPDLIAVLDALLRDADFVHLTRVVDAETEPGDTAASRLYISFRRGGRAHTASGATLRDVLAEVGAARRRCSRCGETKPLTAFPRAPVRPDRPDGRHSHCKVCDRLRKRGKYGRRRLSAAAPAPAP